MTYLKQDYLQEVLDRYPIRSTLPWMRHEDNSFSIEASDFGPIPASAPLTDPWNRPIPLHTGKAEIVPIEGEVSLWNYTTTIEGVSIKLVVFND